MLDFNSIFKYFNLKEKNVIAKSFISFEIKKKLEIVDQQVLLVATQLHLNYFFLKKKKGEIAFNASDIAFMQSRKVISKALDFN